MKVTFVSNYINHHQIPFCMEMYERLGEGFAFIQTQPMEAERVELGWQQNPDLPYVYYAYKEPKTCSQLVMNSDVVIWGGVEDESMLKPRLEAGKPVLRYSERLYKTGQWKAITPRGLWKKYHDHTKYRKKNVYLLCAGAYVASDFHIIRSYPNKMLKWGYFPECKEYHIESLLEGKESDKKEILWVGRFIDWKHPELVIAWVKELIKRRKDFRVTMIGGGELRESVEELIKENALEEYITLAGVKSPQEVRRAMEQSAIFLMTSDRQEGWGAVMNEAMNSGCCVIANRMEGAAPYLITPEKNGYVYGEATISKVPDIINKLLDDKKLREEIGKKAYEIIAEEWNAKVATERLLQICAMMCKEEVLFLWESGPCSPAEIMKEKR